MAFGVVLGILLILIQWYMFLEDQEYRMPTPLADMQSLKMNLKQYGRFLKVKERKKAFSKMSPPKKIKNKIKSLIIFDII